MIFSKHHVWIKQVKLFASYNYNYNYNFKNGMTTEEQMIEDANRYLKILSLDKDAKIIDVKISQAASEESDFVTYILVYYNLRIIPGGK